MDSSISTVPTTGEVREVGFRVLESIVGEPRGFAAFQSSYMPQVVVDLGMAVLERIILAITFSWVSSCPSFQRGVTDMDASTAFFR